VSAIWREGGKKPLRGVQVRKTYDLGRKRIMNDGTVWREQEYDRRSRCDGRGGDEKGVKRKGRSGRGVGVKV